MKVFTQILLKVEFGTPLLLRLFPEADGWVSLLRHNPLSEILYTQFF